MVISISAPLRNGHFPLPLYKHPDSSAFAILKTHSLNRFFSRADLISFHVSPLPSHLSFHSSLPLRGQSLLFPIRLPQASALHHRTIPPVFPSSPASPACSTRVQPIGHPLQSANLIDPPPVQWIGWLG